MVEYLGGVGGLINLNAQLRPISNAMRKVSGKLLHFADSIGQVAMAQHSIVSAHQIVALALSGLLVTSRREKLLNLPEDPWIGGCRASDHYCVAARLPHHPNARPPA